MDSDIPVKPIAVLIAGVVAIFLIIALIPFTVVGAGQRGVVFNNVSGLENRILGEGIHFRTPFVESVVIMPVRTQATEFTENAGTSDSQTVDVNVTVNWHLDASAVNKIYQSVGNSDAIVSKILTNNTQDSVKASVSKYQALEFQKNRENVRSTAQDLLQKKVAKYNIFIDNLSFTNIKFSTEFNAAVEQAQVAQQKAKQAEYQVQQAKAEAQSAIAKAQGEAEAQRQVQQSLTPELLEKLAIEKWDGHYPTYMLGSQSVPLINISK